MNQIRIILRPIAVTLIIQSLFILLCAGVALYYGEHRAMIGFLYTCVITSIIASIVWLTTSGVRAKGNISIRTGFMLVAFTWISVSVNGALPFIFSGYIPNIADAIFESTSGFTTTGATVLSGLDSLPYSINLWRGLTHWLGGGGIIVLSVAILPLLGIGGMQMMRAESSGVQMQKATPRIAQTAKYLWILYVSLTAIFTAILMYLGLDWLDAFFLSASAIATGGFAPKDASVGYYNSAFVDWVLIVAMVIGAINFVLLIRFARGNFKAPFKDTEFKVFISVIIVVCLVVTLNLKLNTYDSWIDSFRYGTFQVVSLITTTGFSTANYAIWPVATQALLFVLFFIGGSSGSTSGGIKITRHVIMIKQALNEFKSLIHPNGVFLVRLNGKVLDSEVIRGVMGFFILFISVALITTYVVALSGLDLWSSFCASLATLSTVGPGFGHVGPAHNYGFLPDYAKYALSVNMLLGRLEIYTLLVIITPWFWKR